MVPTSPAVSADEQDAIALMREDTLKIFEQARPSIDGLVGLATRYDRSEQAMKIAGVKDTLKRGVFRTVVLGRFKNGKSTFLNAMLGKSVEPVPGLPRGGAPLPTLDLPATAVLTSIAYGKIPSVRVIHFDGTREPWTFERYLTEARIRPSKEETDRFFKDIKEFELTFPAELCEAGVVLVDSPGTDEDRSRDMTTLEAVEKGSAAIVMFRHDTLAGLGEQQYVRDMIDAGMTHFFLVVNLWGNKVMDEELKATIWNRLVTDMQGGAPYSGQSLESANIYVVQALKALEGKLSSNRQLVAESGLAQFEDRLRQFLEKDKRAVHVDRCIKLVHPNAAAVKQEIERHAASLQVDQQQFHSKYLEIQPRFEAIRKRRKRIPKIVDAHRDRCLRAMGESLDALLDEILAALPGHMGGVKLPSLEGGWSLQGLWNRARAGVNQRQLCTEAGEAANAFVVSRLKRWQTSTSDSSGVQAVTRKAMQALVEEVCVEVAEVSHQYAEIQMELVGQHISGGHIEVTETSMVERILAGGFGALLHAPDLALAGRTHGFQGIARAVGSQLVVGSLLVFLGTPLLVLSPALVLTGILTNVLWGADNLERQVKESAAQFLIRGDPKTGDGSLRLGFKNNVRPQLQVGVNELFSRISVSLEREVACVMSEEERSVKNQLEESQKNSQEKVKALEATRADLSALENYLAALDSLNARVQQSSISP